jgi:hypothetical protein
MRLIYALVFAFLLSATAMADPRSITRLSQLIIKDLDCKEASFDEALGKVKEAWTQKYKDDPFPVIVVTDLNKPLEKGLRYTAKLKNIPALTALNYVANGFYMEVRCELDIVFIRKTSDPNAILQAANLEVSPRAARVLGFQPTELTPTPIDARENLRKFGIQIDGDTLASFLGSFLFIRNARPEIEKLRGILLLIDSGFTITKDPAEK